MTAAPAAVATTVTAAELSRRSERRRELDAAPQRRAITVGAR